MGPSLQQPKATLSLPGHEHGAELEPVSSQDLFRGPSSACAEAVRIHSQKLQGSFMV